MTATGNACEYGELYARTFIARRTTEDAVDRRIQGFAENVQESDIERGAERY
jgi:hypothetical protein